MKKTPTTSILSNSPHTEGKEQTNRFGTFRIDWVPAIDAHALLHESPDKNGVACLATHHNGHCLQEVIDRMVKGDASRVESQVKYILDCGGMARNPVTFQSIMEVK